VGQLTGQNWVPLIFEVNWGWTEQTYSLGTEKQGWGMVMLLVQNVLTVWLDIYYSQRQVIAIPGVVRLLYQDYAPIAWKHNFVYDSVFSKHGVWQFQEMLYILSLSTGGQLQIKLCPLVIQVQSLFSYFRSPWTDNSNNFWWQNQGFKSKTYIVQNK